jgi:hypothetical protein
MVRSPRGARSVAPVLDVPFRALLERRRWSDPKATRGILGANVRRLRKAQRLSQERLAKLTDLDEPHISEIKAGLINVTLDNVQALAIALCVEPSDLLKPAV